MCGITGTIGIPDDASLTGLERGLARLQHRGPEATGLISVSTSTVCCTLGHARLRIIDTDPAADQPLSDEKRLVWVVYNGEIYNHVELRRELEQAGYQFRTSTDTEVLVHLYHHVGGNPEAMLARIRGMFAFGLFDRARGRLLLARDRLGIKPLYWAPVGSSLVFASEVRSLAATGLVSVDPDEAAIRSYLSWGVVQGPRTVFSGVSALPPGSYLTWEGGARQEKTWWEPVIAPAAITRDDAVDRLRVTLHDAVGRHMIADRPVGVFLSSGVDSSAVTAFAAEHGQVRALTVSLPGSARDETVLAQQVAKELGVDHECVVVEGLDVARVLPEILSSMDQPTLDGVNTWMICRAAREAGLVVVLSGLGGDELFGGYPTFRLVPRAAVLLRATSLLPRGATDIGARVASHYRPGGRVGRMLSASNNDAGAYRAVRGLFGPTELGRRDRDLAEADLPWIDGQRLTSADRVTLLEMVNYQANQLLRDTDQMSMAHTLEARVPLLDDEVVRLCLTLPAGVRTAPGKELLRAAARISLPVAKRPFTLPFDRWMRTELRETVREALLSDTLPMGDLIPGPFRRRVWETFEQGHTHWSRPWAIAVLRLWPAANGLAW